jgi:hypothetical protein
MITKAHALDVLMSDADLTATEAMHVAMAHKAIIGGNWFCLDSEGNLAGGPVNADGSLDYSLYTTIDMPDAFEYPELCAQARAMLEAPTRLEMGVENMKPQAMLDAIRRGPGPVIGYGHQSQKAFEHGWNAAKDEVYRAAKEAGMLPMVEDADDEELKPVAVVPQGRCFECRWAVGYDERVRNVYSEWFTEERGYTAEDRRKVAALNDGDVTDLTDLVGQQHYVTRTA